MVTLLSFLRRHAPLIIYWVAIPLIVLAATEVAVATFWQNPYNLQSPHSTQTRFYPGGLLAYLSVRERLYDGVHRIRFFVDENFAIAGRTFGGAPSAIALGGSTTECGAIPEGSRWPDLLAVPTLNYGVSGNTSADGYRNLKYLLETSPHPPRYVFVMFAINDLRAFLHGEPGAHARVTGDRRLENPLVTLDQADQMVLPGLRIRDSALLSFLRYEIRNRLGRVIFDGYLQQRREQDAFEQASNEEFQDLVESVTGTLLPERREAYERLVELATNRGVHIVLMSQPHAYDTAYEPWYRDLRLFPTIKGKKLTVEQSAAVMELLNSQTRALSSDLKTSFIDVAECFSGQAVSPLFYDSVHYTPKGARLFAQCMNDNLAHLVQTTPSP